MHLDPLFLSRLQFAWVVAWHFLLPAFTVGLASFIAVMEGLHLFTGRGVYLRVSIFWTRIFAVSFGMGVVSGITMPFQFGTNWSRFSDDVGDIISPLLGYEGLTAFFLEAAFLGVLLFGRNLVPRWAHFFAALMVALGTLASTFWIFATNSWMQTPAGFELVDGRFQPKDWLAIIFNPSFPYRLAHVVTAIYITTGFVVAGVASWWLLKRRFYEEARTMLSMTLWLLSVLVPLQALIGDQHGLDTLRYQPAKIDAMEAIWDAAGGSLGGVRHPRRRGGEEPVRAFDSRARQPHPHPRPGRRGARPEGLPAAGPAAGRRAVLRLPHHAGRLGPDDAGRRPAWWLRLRRELFDADWHHRLCVFAAPVGFVAVIAGWATTEVGRQPWTVYGLLRTADSVSPSLSGATSRCR